MDANKTDNGTKTAQDGARNCDFRLSNGCTLEEAHDELRRENEVRKRCYGKWIDEGRLSRSDARDRTARMDAAIEIIKKCLDMHDLPF